MHCYAPVLPSSSSVAGLRAARSCKAVNGRSPARVSAVAAPEAPAEPRSFAPSNDWGVYQPEALTPELAKRIEEAGIDFENSQLKWLSNSGRVSTEACSVVACEQQSSLHALHPHARLHLFLKGTERDCTMACQKVHCARSWRPRRMHQDRIRPILERHGDTGSECFGGIQQSHAFPCSPKWLGLLHDRPTSNKQGEKGAGVTLFFCYQHLSERAHYMA